MTVKSPSNRWRPIPQTGRAKSAASSWSAAVSTSWLQDQRRFHWSQETAGRFNIGPSFVHLLDGVTHDRTVLWIRQQDPPSSSSPSAFNRRLMLVCCPTAVVCMLSTVGIGHASGRSVRHDPTVDSGDTSTALLHINTSSMQQMCDVREEKSM